jgi:hypothetical protein
MEEAKISLEALMQGFARSEQHPQGSGDLGPESSILLLLVFNSPRIVPLDMQERSVLPVPGVQRGDQEHFSTVDASEQEARIGKHAFQRPYATLHTWPISRKN